MTTDTTALTRRHEFVLYFDVVNGNPNGDPDAGNLPRLDPETNRGLVSDVALKRKVRNYVALARPEAPGHAIYMRDGATLNVEHGRARKAITPEATSAEDLKKLPKDEAKAREVIRWMCANFYDIRAFGAVMTTGVNAGQVRGPVQITFATSVEPVLPLEISITRLAATTEKDADEKGGRTMGRKHIVPYGLYRAHGFVSAPLASHPTKGTGFSAMRAHSCRAALGRGCRHRRRPPAARPRRCRPGREPPWHPHSPRPCHKVLHPGRFREGGCGRIPRRARKALPGGIQARQAQGAPRRRSPTLRPGDVPGGDVRPARARRRAVLR